MKPAPARNYALDLLRVVACYMVIQIHAGEFYYIGPDMSVGDLAASRWVAVLNSMLRAAVPLFVMVSGYFILPLRDTPSVFFRRRFTRVLIPFLIWCALYAIYQYLRGTVDMATAGENILKTFVNFGTEVGHLWYIYMLIGLYLFAPVISPWLQSASRGSMRLFLGIWAFSLCVPYIHRVFPEILGECYWNRTTTFYYFAGFLGYMVLAVYIKRFMAERRRWHLPFALALMAVGYAITAGGFLHLLTRVDNVADLELTWGMETINVAMIAFGIFLIFKNIRFREPASAFARGVAGVSRMTYGMYLVHMMVLNFFYTVFASSFTCVVPRIFVMSICSFAVSYLVMKLLSLIPGSKYITG